MFERFLASIELEQIAKRLNSVRRASGLKTTLVLGSRAGGLFRRPALHYLAQALVPAEQQAASPREQFAECFRQLTKKTAGLSTTEQYALLTGALEHVNMSEADHRLAQMIIQGYFDPVITTGADELLEQALMEAGWRPLHNFEVIHPTILTETRMLSGGRHSGCTVLKVFDSLANQQYVLSNRYEQIGNMLRHQGQALSEVLRRDCLIVGFDETWDETLYHLFPPFGDTCWFITEAVSERLYALKETRNVLLLHEKDCVEYETFFVRLYNLLTESSAVDTANRAEKAASSVTSPPAQIKEKRQQDVREVFISYHESDEVYLNRFVEHLANLKREGLIKDWFIGKIQAGQAVEEITQHYLERCTVFLPLISPSFVDSSTLYQQMQLMVERHRAKKALVIPILIRPVDWESMALGRLAALPDDGLFVTRWRNYDSAFLNIVQGIRRALTEC